ncbi:unnamed protein product [marine sediment metagenome]|uniref:Cytochrome c domain-containing protein n=1 Tax=marine sediment metagenome TaxID=412755 RepID=X0VSI1_9ZZZZ
MILGTLMQRRGAVEAMTDVLAKVNVSVDSAKLISRWLSAAGHDDAKLTTALRSVMGIEAGKPIPYSEQFVRTLAREVQAAGDAEAGSAVFAASLTNCAACHRIKSRTAEHDAFVNGSFAKGPDLTSVAAGLPLELIIEAIVWPQRQIKEGYEMTTLWLDNGRTVSGYLLAESGKTISIRDLSTGKILEIPADTVEERAKVGSAMPAGFTHTLTRQELRDLARYLSERKSP